MNGLENKEREMKKGSLVLYRAGEHLVHAIIRTMHRDGTATVEARHFIENGNLVGLYLGYSHRLPVEDLSAA